MMSRGSSPQIKVVINEIYMQGVFVNISRNIISKEEINEILASCSNAVTGSSAIENSNGKPPYTEACWFLRRINNIKFVVIFKKYR